MKQNKYIVYLIFAFLLLSSFSFASEPAWELLSMNPPRGYVWDIKIVNNKIFLATEGGVFSSYLNVLKWEKLLDGQFLKVLVASDNKIFAYKYDEWRSGLYLSTDLGNTWSVPIHDTVDYISTISIDNEGKRLFGWKVDLDSNKNYQTNIYQSTDGFNWTKYGISPKLLNGYSYTDYNFALDSVFIYFSFSKDYRIDFVITCDMGNTWRKYIFPDNKNFYDIIMKSKNEYYAATSKGIYYTNDFGMTWEPKWLDGIQINKIFFLKNFIYAISNNDLYFSSDSGENWTSASLIKDFNPIVDLRSNIIMDSDSNVYLSRYYIGIFKSTNYGKDWSEINNGYSATCPNDLLFFKDLIYFSKWGIFKSTDKGKTFEYKGLIKYNTGDMAINSRGEIFVGDLATGGTDVGLFKSTDEGDNWNDIDPGARSVEALLINPKDYIFIDTGFSSIDDGNTWQDSGLGYYFLAINDEGHFFGFSSGHIYRSTDDGVSWTEIATTKVDPTYNEYGGKIIFNNRTKTAAYYDLITTDNGRTWNKLKDSGYTFATTSTNEFAVDSTYNWVYSGDYYILRSTNNGKSWKRMDTTGFKTNSFQTIGCSPDGHIYVFGSTGGLYRSRDAFVSVSQKVMDNIYNVSITPNPARTKIKLDIPIYNPSDFMLFHRNEIIQVYDILGACVLQVKPDLESALYNDNQIGLDISALATGAYYLRYGRYSQHFVKFSN